MPNTDPVSSVDNQVLAEQVYDMIMADIEPDLLLTNIPLLDQKYSGETPEERAERTKRYEAAYKKFDAEFNNFMIKVDEKVHSSRRDALRAQEDAAKEQEAETMSSITSAFN